jgi:hypothetical protein
MAANRPDAQPVRAGRWPVAAALSAVLALAPAATHASDQQNSKSGSSNSSDSNSSNGSKDSSNSSKDSSNNSQGSSKNSNNSTQNSPKNTSDWTTNGTSDWSTHSHGAHVFSIALAIVVVGGASAATTSLKQSQPEAQRQAALALAAYLRQQHALLTHDVALASGPVLDSWTHDLKLTAADQRRFAETLDGSPEQGALLEALDGPIDERRAQRFATVFMRVTERTLGPMRTRALVTRVAAVVESG